uniref:Uncharacterized protein n=1 Tax=Anopheles culicifacies TaxID=139723 RepID=A0A182MNE2_9DIPT
MENKPDMHYEKHTSTTGHAVDSTNSLQPFPLPRSRCHPVLSDVTRLETIRERNSVYSEDGEFIDLPLPPVPNVSNIAKGEVSAVDRKHHDSHDKGSDVASEANAYLQSRLRDFEETDVVTGGEDGTKKSIRSLAIDCSSDAGCASDLTKIKKPQLLLMEEDANSIDSSTASNTLHKSAWSVASIGSTGGEYSNGDYKPGYCSDSIDSDEADLPEEDDYGEHSSGYRDRSPFLRSISLSPVERRFRKLSTSHERRRRANRASSGQSSRIADGWNRQISLPYADHEAGDRHE